MSNLILILVGSIFSVLGIIYIILNKKIASKTQELEAKRKIDLEIYNSFSDLRHTIDSLDKLNNKNKSLKEEVEEFKNKISTKVSASQLEKLDSQIVALETKLKESEIEESRLLVLATPILEEIERQKKAKKLAKDKKRKKEQEEESRRSSSRSSGYSSSSYDSYSSSSSYDSSSSSSSDSGWSGGGGDSSGGGSSDSW